MNSPRTKPRILSGVQPSGKLHLGNYFGAIQNHIALQDRGEAFYFIADYHALTTLKSVAQAEADRARKARQPIRTAAEILRENVHDVALDYLALGLDPAKATFYRQSDVPEVTELAWILATVTGMGLLERAHSFKDKKDKGIEASVGLFTYPVLMAADILIVRADLVPVGKDQVQHLEMTRDMAGYFNNTYGQPIFPEPKEWLSHAPVVPGTDGQKMSKSYGNTIEIFAEGKALQTAVAGIKTDSRTVEEPKDPTTCNVFALFSLFANPAEREEMAQRYRAGGLGYGMVKSALVEKINQHFAEARERRRELAKRPDDVEDVLRTGARRAREEAQATMDLVRSACGLR